MPASSSRREPARPTPVGAEAAAGQHEHGPDHQLTITIPVDRVADAVTASVSEAGHVLSARGGLPLYVGLGVLAAADVIAWPAAVAAGVGYAVLRRWGPRAPSVGPALERPPGTPREGAAAVAAREAQVREAQVREDQAREEAEAREVQVGQARARAAAGTDAADAGSARGEGRAAAAARPRASKSGAGTRGTGTRRAGGRARTPGGGTASAR